MSVYLLATLDTKGREIAFVRERLETLGVTAQLVDTGCLGEPAVEADITREQVFAAADVTCEVADLAALVPLILTSEEQARLATSPDHAALLQASATLTA